VDEVTIVWRFNLAEGVVATEFFAWLKENVWASTGRFGCSTTGYLCESEGHDFATIATWPNEGARADWEREEMPSLPTYPGVEGPWGAQADMAMIRLSPLAF